MGRERAAGGEVGRTRSPFFYLIYTSDGWRLRNPFAGSGGVRRLVRHKIMMRKSSSRRQRCKRGDYSSKGNSGVEAFQTPRKSGWRPTGSKSPRGRKLVGNFGGVQLGIGKTLRLNGDHVASLPQLEVGNSTRSLGAALGPNFMLFGKRHQSCPIHAGVEQEPPRSTPPSAPPRPTRER